MKSLNSKSIILLLFLLISGCKKDELIRTNPYDTNGKGSTFPAIYTGNTATSGNIVTYYGEVASDGGLPLEERGVCYNYSGNPSISFYRISAGSGAGRFECEIPGLLSGFTYYLRGYAINAVGISYGAELAVHIY